VQLMDNQNALSRLAEVNPVKKGILIDRSHPGAVILSLGYMKRYEFIESENELLFFFSRNKNGSLFDCLFSEYLIHDVKLIGIFGDNILVDNDSWDKITRVKLGLLELLKISKPLLERLESEEAHSFSMCYFSTAIQKDEISANSQAIFSNSWKMIAKAKASNDSQTAYLAFQSIAHTLEQESMIIKERNTDMADALSFMGRAISNKAIHVEKKQVSVSDAEKLILYSWFL
jgi:hypothetical protein